MNRAAILDALKKIEGEIVGLKKFARRKYGGAHSGTLWPDAVMRKMRILKGQAEEYRRRLAVAKEPG